MNKATRKLKSQGLDVYQSATGSASSQVQVQVKELVQDEVDEATEEHVASYSGRTRRGKTKERVDYLVRPDGPPFVTLNVREKIDALGLTYKGFRELTLRCAMPCLVDSGNLRLALTGFDKSQHDTVLPLILERLDFVLSMQPDDEMLRVFKDANPWYRTGPVDDRQVA